MHGNNEGTPADHSGNPQAYINHIQDKNSHGQNPIRYRSPARKSNSQTYSQ